MLGDPDHVQLHRVLRATPERIYRAFVDPEAMVKWLPPGIAGAAGKTWGGGDSGALLRRTRLSFLRGELTGGLSRCQKSGVCG